MLCIVASETRNYQGFTMRVPATCCKIKMPECESRAGYDSVSIARLKYRVF